MATTAPPTVVAGIRNTQIVLEVLHQDDGTNAALRNSQSVLEVLTQDDGTNASLRCSQIVVEVLSEAPPYDTTPGPTTTPPTTVTPTTGVPTTAPPTGPPTTAGPTAPPTTAAPTTVLTTAPPAWTGPPVTFPPFETGFPTEFVPDVDEEVTTAYPEQIVPTSCEVFGHSVTVAQAAAEMPVFTNTFVQISGYGIEMLVGKIGALIPEAPDTFTLPPGGAAPEEYEPDSIGFIEDDI